MLIWESVDGRPGPSGYGRTSRMSDHLRSPRCDEARGLWPTAGRCGARSFNLWPYIWPSDRPDLKARVLLVAGAAARRQARHHRGAVHLQMGDRCARPRAGPAGNSWIAWVIAAPLLMTVGLWRHAHPDGGVHPDARRHVRQGVDACGAAARDPHLRAHAPAVAALPSRAQDRRADPRARARPQRHRDHRAHGDPAARPDHRRSG